MKRILSIDGGGIRALFSIEVLYRIERLLADRFGDPEGFRLCQYFDFMAGTSTGAIVCAMLSWGYRVEEVRDMYLEHGRRVFTPNRPWRLWKARFTADPLTALLKGYFVERDGSPALLGSRQLKTLLLIVMRNMSTGSPWPVTNNPRSLYNDRSLADCNLNIPLWQLIRASTAAPTYFPPETVTLGEQTFSFVDGGISPYNNPSLIAFLFATLPQFHIQYETGVDKLLLVSVGSGRVRKPYLRKDIVDMNILDHVRAAMLLLVGSVELEQDLVCRVLGDCRVGEDVDSEIGDLKGESGGDGKTFTYLRYNHTFSDAEREQLPVPLRDVPLDAADLSEFLVETGRRYAQDHVRIEDLI